MRRKNEYIVGMTSVITNDGCMNGYRERERERERERAAERDKETIGTRKG